MQGYLPEWSVGNTIYKTPLCNTCEGHSYELRHFPSLLESSVISPLFLLYKHIWGAGGITASLTPSQSVPASAPSKFTILIYAFINIFSVIQSTFFCTQLRIFLRHKCANCKKRQCKKFLRVTMDTCKNAMLTFLQI